MAPQFPYDVEILRNGADAGDNGAQARIEDVTIFAGPSTLYSSSPALSPPYSTQIPQSLDQGDRPEDGAQDPPAGASKDADAAAAKEDCTVSPESRGCSRRNLLIGLFVFLVVLGAALGGALGATLGKHASRNENAKMSTSVSPSSTTSSTPNGSATSATTSIATAAGASMSTTSTTSTATSTTSSGPPPLVTPGVAYIISNPGTNNTVITLTSYDARLVAGQQGNGGQNQQWKVQPVDLNPGYWHILDVTGKYYVDTDNAISVDPWDDVSVAQSDYSYWWLIERNPASAGTVRIRDPNSSLVFTLTNRSGTPIVMLDFASDISQAWIFTPAT